MSQSGPRVAVHLGVLNEASLIAASLAHLRAIGVDEILVHDLGSRDGTLDILARDGGADLRVLHTERADTETQMWTRLEAAVAQSRADWMLMIDADEFVLPAGGDIRAALAPVAGAMVMLPRYNVALGPGGLQMPLPPGTRGYDAVQLHARPDPKFRRRLAQDPTLAWLAMVPLPKVAVRPAHVGGFAAGMHDAFDKAGTKLAAQRAENIVIAHVALSDYPRFADKVENIRETFALHEGDLPGNFGWHWRRWVALADAGDLRGEYDRSILTAEAMAALRAEGALRSAAALILKG